MYSKLTGQRLSALGVTALLGAPAQGMAEGQTKQAEPH
jgi:hypothetical protein